VSDVNEATAALFVMPRRHSQWGGAAALWVTAAGWADAARRRFGHAWIVSPDGVATPEEALDFTRPTGASSSAARAPRVPIDVRNAMKDARQWQRARAFRPGDAPEWTGERLAFVWQHHDLFHHAGENLAHRYGVPIVSYVHAPQVWEARKWGVRRPGYGGLLERVAERPQLLASDVICCVSNDVAEELTRFGVERDRILVSPMAVDANRFSPEVSGTAVREGFGLGEGFVVGWIGSFRGFHGLESVVESFGRVVTADPAARLLLVGEGSERNALEAHVRALGLSASVVFTGAVANPDIPEHIAAMDVALVSARPGDDFHYSPLKLREYLACGRAVVAPNLGEIPTTVSDGTSALLYDVGDSDDLAAKLEVLRGDPAFRSRVAAAGRELAVATSTWDLRLRDLLNCTPYRRALARGSR